MWPKVLLFYLHGCTVALLALVIMDEVRDLVIDRMEKHHQQIVSFEAGEKASLDRIEAQDAAPKTVYIRQ